MHPTRRDSCSCASVFVGEPGVCQMQVDAGRLDGAMTGLRLHGLQGHARFAQPSQAGMAQLIAGEMSNPRAVTGAVHDLVETVGAERLTSPQSFEDDEYLVGIGVRPFPR